MSPIVVNIDPVLLQAGPLVLRWYSLAIMAGVAVGLYTSLSETRRKGIPQEEMLSMGMWAILGGVVGARLFHIVDNWQYYQSNPLAILAVQQGGMAILGGIAGGAVVGIIYIHRRCLPLGKMADAAAPGLILGQAIGRIGCIINGDAVGVPTDLPWGFAYLQPGAMAPILGQAYQPTMIYEMAWDLIVLGALWWARGRLKVDGTLFLLYLGLYSAGKLFVSFWRQEAVLLAGLQEAQLVSLGIIAFVVVLTYRLISSHREAPRVG